MTFLLYATLGLWAVAIIAVFVNLARAIAAPRERRLPELLAWFSFLALGAGGWYPLVLLHVNELLPWLSFIYGAPALVLAHSVRLFVLARREAAASQPKSVPVPANQFANR